MVVLMNENNKSRVAGDVTVRTEEELKALHEVMRMMLENGSSLRVWIDNGVGLGPSPGQLAMANIVLKELADQLGEPVGQLKSWAGYMLGFVDSPEDVWSMNDRNRYEIGLLIDYLTAGAADPVNLGRRRVA